MAVSATATATGTGVAGFCCPGVPAARAALASDIDAAPDETVTLLPRPPLYL